MSTQTMSTQLFRMLVALSGILGVAALIISFSINPTPPTGATTAQIVVWGREHENLILAGSWLQAIGSFLEVVFILAIIHIAGATQRLSGWITAFAAIVIMAVSLVEVSFYLSAIQGGVNGDLTTLAVSLNLIKAIQHAYVIVPAPTILLGLGVVILNSHVFPRIFGYLALALGVIMGILGFVGTFIPLQQVIDSVLTVQEVWFAALAISVRKAANGAETILPARA